MMKIHSMTVFVVCLLSAPAFADKPVPVSESKPAPKAAPGLDYQAGAAAYDAGDYAKALSIWQPLAEKGDTQAQRGMGKLYEKGQGDGVAPQGRGERTEAGAAITGQGL